MDNRKLYIENVAMDYMSKIGSDDVSAGVTEYVTQPSVLTRTLGGVSAGLATIPTVVGVPLAPAAIAIGATKPFVGLGALAGAMAGVGLGLMTRKTKVKYEPSKARKIINWVARVFGKAAQTKEKAKKTVTVTKSLLPGPAFIRIPAAATVGALGGSITGEVMHNIIKRNNKNRRKI